ncbi:MAG: DUF2075 domain-containing protein, partial [Methanomassiliicoccaceae archaeon]|nr:DUF2075 domain-containing protein [Methanomassiliicoccaceae archaeon]
HPSYQAWSYASVIRNFNEEVQNKPILLYPCAYLHNYVLRENDPLTDSAYKDHIEKAPVFLRQDRAKLQEFIKKHIKYGDNKETLYLIDNGKLRPSKSLQDSLARMLNGNEEFIMLDQQKVVFEDVLKISRKTKAGDNKFVTIVEGGPGTGKSVLAVNLLVKLTEEGMVAKYVTKNQAPRYVYSSKLKGTKRKTEIDNLFGGSGNFFDVKTNTFDVIVADEAHRLNEKSGLYSNMGENQIKELINAARHTVFLIDEKQRVTVKDIGTVAEIKKHSKALGIKPIELKLDSQFRCNGSNGYMDWVDNVLQIEGTEHIDSEEEFEYEIKLFDDPEELRKAVEEKNTANNKSRLVAGYCWNWISNGKNRSDVHDIVIGDFGMSWNLGSTATWAIDESSVAEISCIHTCQGLEFDYVGVIIGDDLRFEKGMVITDPAKRAKTDKSLSGLKTKYKDEDEAREVADYIIRNTYRTLLTRGMKGCYIYCTDTNLREHIRSLLPRSTKR